MFIVASCRRFRKLPKRNNKRSGIFYWTEMRKKNGSRANYSSRPRSQVQNVCSKQQMIKYIFLIVFSCSLSHFVKHNIDERRAKITFDMKNVLGVESATARSECTCLSVDRFLLPVTSNVPICSFGRIENGFSYYYYWFTLRRTNKGLQIEFQIGQTNALFAIVKVSH